MATSQQPVDAAPPPRYVPVKPGPLRMRAALLPLGTEFGNGAVDHHHFQIDRQRPAYLQEKARRWRRPGAFALTPLDPTISAQHEACLSWMERTLDHEHPGARKPPAQPTLEARYAALVHSVQEDFVVVARTPHDTDAMVAVMVCFPGGWQPERILGQSFAAIHVPVPDFADTVPAARAMVTAMIERGPYVRFVSSVVADDRLDHHPTWAPRAPFVPGGRGGFLRVERQVTVPFPAAQAALFLIRTYVYPFAALTDKERHTLTAALATASREVQSYKGIEGSIKEILRRLNGCKKGPR